VACVTGFADDSSKSPQLPPSHDLPRNEFSVVEHLKKSLLPLASEVFVDRLEPNFQPRAHRQGLSYPGEYDCGTRRPDMQKVLLVGEKENRLSRKALYDDDVRRSSLAELDQVLGIMPLLPQPSR
jgi:hypothetical protein